MVTRVTLDQSTISQLLKPHAAVEIFDEQGNIVGIFRPATVSDRAVAELDITEDEIQRRLNEPGRKTLEEIMRDLEKTK